MRDIKAFTEVGRRLHEEHEATLEILNTLETVILARSPSEPMDLTDHTERGHLERLVGVVESDVTRHFDFEEQVLFPVLRNKGAGDMADMLTHEHAAIKPIAHRLAAIANHALKQGFNDPTWREFRVQVIELMEREAFHIQKEEMAMVRPLSFILDSEEDRELARRYDEM